MNELLETVLHAMSSVNKPQRKFMMSLFSVLMIFQGRATFRNMSRYCTMSVKRFSRWFNRTFDFAQFNHMLLDHALSKQPERIAAIDASFMSKPGTKTDGLAHFYNGSAGESQRGLEISRVCTIDLKSNTAYTIDAQQTMDQHAKSRVDQYAKHVVEIAPILQQQGIRYLAADAYYTKKAFVTPVVETGLNIVGKLRVDADLRWLYSGDYNGKGRPKKFDAKIDVDHDLSRFDSLGTREDGVEVYRAN